MVLPRKQVKGRRVRQGKRERGVWLQFAIGGAVFVIFGLVLTAIWYGTRLQFLTISEIDVEGGETILHTDIRELAERELAGSYLLLIPKRFTYFYPEERLAAVLNAVPRIHNVALERVGLTKISITFDEYIPAALWCSATDEANCLFISAEGFAFAKAPPLRGGAFIRHIIEGKEPELQNQLFTKDELARMNILIDALESQLNLRVGHITHTAEGDERYVFFEGGEIRIDPTEDTQTTFDNLRSILESKEYASLQDGDFNYIDLRFGNRVFVSKEKPIENTASSTVPDAVSSEE